MPARKRGSALVRGRAPALVSGSDRAVLFPAGRDGWLALGPHVVLAGRDDAPKAAHRGLELVVRPGLVRIAECRRADLLVGGLELRGEPAGVEEAVDRARNGVGVELSLRGVGDKFACQHV